MSETPRKIWDALSEGERRSILIFAGIWDADEVVFYEATLKWDRLLPSTQDKVLAKLKERR